MTCIMRSGAWFLLLAAVVVSALSSRAAAADKPNIVVILTDDAGYNFFNFAKAANGGTSIYPFESPNLDALAAQSVVVREGYVAAPVCGPSRAGLLTGLAPNRFGYEDNADTYNSSQPQQGLVTEQVTIAQRLKNLGYTTGAIGKWHEGFTQGYNRPLDKGFDEFYGFLAGHRSYWSNQPFGDSNINWSIIKQNSFYEAQYRTEGNPANYDIRGDQTPGAPDAVPQRYITDAWGEEAVKFIDNHADDEEPFFLYLAYTAPHTPGSSASTKKSDWDHFSHIDLEQWRTVAAQSYAMDRSVGDVMASLAANGIDDNTIVVFMNDNGPLPTVGDVDPMYGWKGTTYEGGIRVPFLIKAPGLTPGVHDDPITAYDLLPTFINAAGGNMEGVPTDGVDVMPYLSGETDVDPHGTIFWRHWDAWSVRKGDWKLTTGITNPDGSRSNPVKLFNITEQNQNEKNAGVAAQNPDKVAVMLAELAHWEAGMAKPKWGALGALTQNTFDHFVFRNDQASTNWGAASVWHKGGTTQAVTMNRADPYANAIFEFTVKNDTDYTSTNDMVRISRQTFMLNQLRLTGTFSGAANHQGTLNGNALLFVKSLTGALPQIRLDATDSGGAAKFAFHLQNEIQLMDNLEITGNGTQNFVISGNIVDFYIANTPASVVSQIVSPHNVKKLGTSKVTLSGNNTFGGSLSVEGGQVVLDGVAAAINGASSIVISNAASFVLQNGTVAVQTVDRSSGGAFQFNGGTLKAVTVLGNLVNNGGTFAPGNSPAASKVVGNYVQNSGKLQVEIGGADAGSQYDTLQVTGQAGLADTLQVQFLNSYAPTAGRAFQILTAKQGVSGTFSTTLLPSLSAGLFWNVMYGPNSVILAVAPTNSLTFIPGDFDLNGTVDSSDYTIWRDRLGMASSIGDANFDGQVTVADYSIWRSNFGASLTGSGSGAFAIGVPEPGTITLSIVMMVAGAASKRRRHSLAL